MLMGTDLEIRELKNKSDALKIRFACSIFAEAFLISVVIWAGDKGYKGPGIALGVVAFLLIWIYSAIVWVLLASVRLKLREARRRGA